MGTPATLSFDASPEVRARLDRLAHLTRRSTSALASEAVERFLVEEEAFVAAVEEGLAQADAGEVVDHARATAFLLALGTDAPLPVPSPGA